MAAHWFVVPPLDGAISGGTLFNRELLRALESIGFPAQACGVETALNAMQRGVAGVYWVDSLYMGALPKLYAERPERALVGMITHYLPSLVLHGSDVQRNALADEERAALETAQAFLAPSPFMKTVLMRLGADSQPILVVEPGRSVARLPPRSAEDGIHAAFIGNVVPGKGVLSFLEALRDQLPEDARFRLSLFGALDADAAYGEACQRFVLEDPTLRERVFFHGVVPSELISERLLDCNLLISASVMEAYGMALSEARAAGIPIIARSGGNTTAHVLSEFGGQLVADARELAAACVAMLKNPVEHANRLQLAYQHALPPRPWSDAAREFAEQASTLNALLAQAI